MSSKHVWKGIVAAGVVSAVTLVIGCAGSKKLAPAPQGLAYRWEKGTTLKYAIETDSRQSVETMGQTFESQTNSNMVVSLTPVEVFEDGSALIDFAIDTLAVRVKSVMGEMKPDLKSLIGKHIKMRVAKTGDVIEGPDSTESLEINLGRMGTVNLEDNFRRLFLNVPGRPVQPGETWVDRDTVQTKRSGLQINVVTETQHSLVEKKPLAGKECYFGRSKGSFTMDGAGKEPMTGSSMAFEGEGTSEYEWYFDPAGGALLQLNGTVTMEGTVSLSGQAEMTMPMETISKLKIRLLQGV